MRYGALTLGIKYIRFWLKAKTKHHVHPPFAYGFADSVLGNAKKIKHPDVETARAVLKRNTKVLSTIDFGTEQGVAKEKKVRHIAKTALKSPKYAALLASICREYKVNNVLELGTSLGITTAYLARNVQGKVMTLEGDIAILNEAKAVWNTLGIQNIVSVCGPFSTTLPDALKQHTYDLIFIDGHHQYAPTLSYFEQILPYITEETIVVMDDIHWSKDMVAAWDKIRTQTEVSLSIDLFFVGVLFFKPSLTKQHYLLRY